MPLKKWEKTLQDGFWIAFQMETSQGRWINFSVVLILHEQCITRYESAHGCPHRDVYGRRNGLMHKEWHANLTLKEAFEYASRDLAETYRTYFEFYSTH